MTLTQHVKCIVKGHIACLKQYSEVIQQISGFVFKLFLVVHSRSQCGFYPFFANLLGYALNAFVVEASGIAAFWVGIFAGSQYSL